MKQYLIIGNGTAGTTASENIRKIDQNCKITLITSENFPIYSRIRLPEYLCGKVEKERLIIKSKEWHTRNNIELITDTTIKQIDFTNKKALASNGKFFNYDKVLISTGSTPFIPPVKGGETEGILTLRNIEDADKIVQICQEPLNIVVIGGGLLGIETASSLGLSGHKVTVVEFFERLLPRQLDKEGACRLQRLLEKNGLTFMLGEVTEEIKEKYPKNSKASENREYDHSAPPKLVKLKSGHILQADLVIFSSGVRADITLAKGPDTNKHDAKESEKNEYSTKKSDIDICSTKESEINGYNSKKSGDNQYAVKTDKGIVVNERMETSLPSVYAAGDVAEFMGVNFSIWPEATEQGRVAGINMAGGSAVYKNIPPSNVLKVAGISLASAGEIDVDGKMECNITSTDTVYKKIVKDHNGKIIGCIMVGDTTDFNKIVKTIKGESQ
ncbi:Pyridine nucleotide-disulfide oxidoreductase [Desulfamplus magnetovallimortis]|uniref:Pyridine nucleotide-disulfide oxidoreductase n=1 Tax=Desulfamplus magnetovallimortis TaxID=1246637 RepID=A0A1W1H840_9BACT|nr:FAD-dependent oxidoreductase [Desulfamplus magnetovallimortis]SLM28647.1 Pyridine nucleotide-disulfide oxidoreductase [Desulfamplus magnetovallimortis]